MTSIYVASHVNLRRIKNVLSVGLFILFIVFLMALLVIPDRVDPLRYLASIDAAVIKVIDNKGKRFVIYRASPGKIFMIPEAYKKTGDTIKVNEYQRLFSRRVEYLLVR